MKLNVGCGLFPVEGWVNIEMNPANRKADVITSAIQLPFQDGSFDRVYCGHVLEHVLWDDLTPLLAELRRVLKPGGLFCAVGPDIFRAREGGWHDDIVHACYGDPSRWDDSGDQHVWSCNEKALQEIVNVTFPGAQAIDIRDLSREWPCMGWQWWQCAVTAVR